MPIAILMLVLAAGAQAPAAPAAAADEAALRALAARYVEGFDREDAPAILAQWLPDTDAYKALQRTMPFRFVRTEYRLTNLAVDRVQVEGDRASLRVIADREIDDRRDTGPGGVPILRVYKSLMAEVLICARQGEDWKIVEQRSAVRELADALLAAAPEDRDRLLAEDARLVSPDLRNAIALRADQQFRAQTVGEAKTTLELAARIAQAAGDQEGLGVTYQNLGNAHYLLGELTIALDYFRKRLAIEQARGSDDGLAAAYQGLATTQYTQGDYASALESYGEALARRERLGQELELPSLLTGLGNTHFLLGDYQPAIEAYRRAAALVERRRSSVELARALSGIGRVLAIQGDFRAALRAFERVLDMAAERRDQAAIADALADVADVRALERDHLLARDLYVLHRDLLETLDDRAGAAFAGLQIGRLELVRGEPAAAERAFRHAAGGHVALGNREGEGRALLGLGFALAGLERFAEAVETYERARDIFDDLGRREDSGRAWLGLALAHAGAGDDARSLEAGAQAVAIGTEVANDDILWRAHVRVGQALRHLGRPDEARAAFDAAIAVFDAERERTAPPREASGFTAERAEPYLGHVDVLAAAGDARAALDWIERARAQVRRDLLDRSPAPITPGLSDAERGTERALVREVVSLATRIARARARRPPDLEAVAELESAFVETRARLGDVRARLADAHPGLPRWRGETAPFDAGAVMAAIPAGTLVLQYVVTEDEVRLFAIDRDRIDGHVLAVASGDLAARVAPALDPATLGSSAAWRAVAGDLYTLLVAPAEARLAGATSLVIVPDGPLWRLPFEALAPAPREPAAEGEAERRPPYLVGRAAVSYATSLTAWVYAREVARARDGSVTPGLLALAAPPFAAERAAALGLGEGFASLAPQLAEEAAAAATPYPTGRHAVHLDDEARESHLWAEAGGYPVLHLAAPGRLDNASPFFSLVALAGADPAAEAAPPASDDGLAAVWELLARDDGPGVVVCTALGWPASGRAGDAITGLSWAWLVAGTPGIIVNRWLVPPAARAPFARALHAALSARIPRSGPADALRLAMLDVMRAPGFDAPAYWAGFMMVGHAE